MRMVGCSKIDVFSQESGELVFSYTEDMEPELLDGGNYFTVYYLWNAGEEEQEVAMCDYPVSGYYYVATELKEGKKVG